MRVKKQSSTLAAMANPAYGVLQISGKYASLLLPLPHLAADHVAIGFWTE
jgi:hypothetical protein